MAKKRRIGDGARIDIPASECYLEKSNGLPELVKDRRGLRCGRLMIQEFVGFQVSRGPKTKGRMRPIWLGQCNCGRFTTTLFVTQESVMGCGCAHNVIRPRPSGYTVPTDPRYKVYRAWVHQIQICSNPNSHGYPFHGKIGIKMCDLWMNNFPAYLEYVGLPPTPGHKLDRIDYDKDFEPGNVRWYTLKEHQDKLHALRQKLKGNPKVPGTGQIKDKSKVPKKKMKKVVGSRIDIPASKCTLDPNTGLPSQVRDRRGDSVGRLVVKEFAGFQVKNGSGKNKAIWRCLCNCGRSTNTSLNTGKASTQSCGCLLNDPSRRRQKL
jgi:hypothetical protein